MNYAAHITAGAITGIGLSYAAVRFHYHLTPPLIIVPALIGSILPDIDHPKSHIGRRFPMFSGLFFKAFGHRTFTHSLPFCFGAGILLMQWNTSIGIGAFAGILSHILLDFLTPFSNGVALFYPFRKRFGIFKS